MSALLYGVQDVEADGGANELEVSKRGDGEGDPPFRAPVVQLGVMGNADGLQVRHLR